MARGAAVASAIFLTGLLAQTAGARSAADPRFNVPIQKLPSACWTAPKGSKCIAASVGYLDLARAKLHQPRYVLPRNFAALDPDEQALVLTNLDRLQYKLAPIPGLTSVLNRAAAVGVRTQADPEPHNAFWAFTSNWAGGYPNIVLAYEGWMYNDGLGSDNVDCTPHHRGGCWDHRHDILWSFGPRGPLAMGAAAGTDSGGVSSFAMLLEQQRPRTHPSYTYRWRQAVRAGARG